MGYLTQHELELVGQSNTNIDYHEKEITKISDYTENVFHAEYKWYNCEKDMLEYSKLHPNLVFKVTGVGEEFPDIWAAYFKNGRMFKEEAKIIYPDFDESKLR